MKLVNHYRWREEPNGLYIVYQIDDSSYQDPKLGKRLSMVFSLYELHEYYEDLQYRQNILERGG